MLSPAPIYLSTFAFACAYAYNCTFSFPIPFSRFLSRFSCLRFTFSRFLSGFSRFLLTFSRFLLTFSRFLSGISRFLLTFSCFLLTFSCFLSGISRFLLTFSRFLRAISQNTDCSCPFRNLSGLQCYSSSHFSIAAISSCLLWYDMKLASLSNQPITLSRFNFVGFIDTHER